MDADDHPVEVVLKEARRFMVPLYQRKYQWADRRLEPFWEDVTAKAVEVLEGDAKFEHYMGALILSPVDQGSQIGITPIVQVVDGQQRLTTFQILLAALREVARHYEFEDIIEHVNGYLLNVPKSKDSDPLTKFKLNPTPSDRELFHDLILMPYDKVTVKYRKLYWGSKVPKNTSFPAFRAYHLFYTWIDDFAFYGPDEESAIDMDAESSDQDREREVEVEVDTIRERLEALLTAVLDRLKLVVITLGENDDAQVIFETLNSKGEPLLAMDLVRNNIFHRAEKQKAQVEDLYSELWDPLDHSWWKEAAPNARPTRPRIDHFLAHVLAAETGEKISMRELYAEYRAFAVPKGKPRFENVEDELRLIEVYSPHYESLEGRSEADPTLYWLGRKLASWQVTTAYPVAMQIGRAELEPDERDAIARLIYSYIVRRAICGLTTKNLNRVFQAIAAQFVSKGVTKDVFADYFSDKTGDSTKFPDDAEFRNGILNGNAYSIAPSTRLVDILWELELASRTKLAEQVSDRSGLWIEHVLPQSWGEDWPFSDGTTLDRYSEDDRAVARNMKLHTLGNLTLLSGGLNISSGNKNFETKKDKFNKNTGLFLNKWFQNHSKWDEQEIAERGEALAGHALKIWAGLETRK
ncbi:DUF262 domain-containing protein [uncultured Hoeflea sp.]|uniref:DUF262 domain-containing protein n=1 Tax=uncultured Hoeflea sp. TaxID=538666 RepID=UPI0030EE806A|tara:strand:+ start:144391 stop:146301 length:1911 start_codon:yes stop_codon:yes gene_type:complete